MLFLIVLEDRFCTYVGYIQLAGLIYLIGVVVIASWAGLRSSLAACALLEVYVWIVYHYPISALGRDHARLTQAMVSTAVVYPLFAVIAGVVQAKLRAAATREYDARVAADEESQQRRIAEAELWTSEEMRRLIVDSSADAIIAFRDDGVTTMWNPNAAKLLGWRQSEAIGSPVEKLIVLSKDSGEANLLSLAKTLGPDQRAEVTARGKSCDDLALELYAADHRTETGTVYIVFVRDISSRKRAELAIQEMNASLEMRVAERTAQLEAANSELVGFTYSVSHDLRTPLRAIVGNSRIVLEESSHLLPPEATERLRRLETNALKMAELIENLLQFARVGQLEIKPRELDLSAMADAVAKDLRERSEGSIAIQPGMRAMGDPDMVMMLLLNLMENAWKYVQPGQKPDVEVGSTSDGAVYVRDRGIGFDMKYVEKIWAPFERLHRDDEYPGTGIGLANAKRIIDRHRGKIWAESKPNEGSTIYFDLPSKVRSASSYVS